VAEITEPENTKVAKPAEDPKKDYADFDGWFTEADGGDPYEWPHTLTGPVTMHAHWTPIPLTITFNTYGDTTVAPITQDGGTTVAQPAEPKKSGHRFLGWFDAEDGVTEYTTWPHPLTKSLTMHAHWIQQFTITFDSHGGSAVEAIKQDVDTTVAQPQPAPTWGVSQFNGWFNAASGGTEYTTWPYTLTGDITMHAQWKHLVTFHPLGGTSTGGASALDPQFVLAGGNATAPTGMTREAGGMYASTIADAADLTVTFVGWYDNPAYSKNAWDFSNDPVNAPLNLYAKWSQPVVDIPNDPQKTIIENALAYINEQTLSGPTDYTIVLDGDVSMAGVSSANINKTNAVITLVGISPTTISLTSRGALFRVNAGELVLDNNITLKGLSEKNNESLVRVEGSSTVLTMKDGATISGNSIYDYYDNGSGVRVDNATFNMSGGTISGNSAKGGYNGRGGGVFVSINGIFNKTGDSVIYGDNDTTNNAPENTAGSGGQGNTNGHAVYYEKGPKYRNSDLLSEKNINTDFDDGWGE
jgi:hypothetical protein